MRLKQSLARAAVSTHAAAKRLYCAPILVYRKALSGAKASPTCRFTPTCSAYALDAIGEWGIVIGTALALVRLVRCNPFSKGGDDPVPKKRDVIDALRRTFGAH